MQKRVYWQQYHVLFEASAPNAPLKMRCDDTAVALPVGEIPYLHYHDCLEIGLCCEGDGLFLSDGLVESVGAGDMIVIFPGSRHYSRSLHANAPCLCRFAYFDHKSLLAMLIGTSAAEERPDVAVAHGADVCGIPPILRESEYPEAVALLRKTVAACFDHTPNRDLLCALTLCEFFLRASGWFAHFHIKRKSEHEHTRLEDDVIASTMSYISLHYAETLTTHELAEMCHLSESQLRRRFRRRYQLSPMAYLHQLRCHIGAELLRHTDMTVAAVSDKVGYEDPSGFYRHFVALVKLSPSEFRKKAMK